MRRTASGLGVLLSVAAAWGGAPRVQTPDAPWATIRTAHYRLHYPLRGEFEGFAQAVARRIEGYHQAVIDLVGHAHQGPTDVVISDPFLAPNGAVFPQLRRPFMILWRRAPESDLEIAHAEDWISGLVPHELVHLHHLTWPDRKPRWWEGFMDNPMRVSELARKSPPWVIEGYATLLEGKLTGQGRPHSAFRAMALRQWAREGQLPAYAKLSEANPRLGGLGRYLLSSAFLAWLEQSRPGQPAVLKDLWARLASRRYSGFDQAFKATFGEAPAFAYGRFCAELAHGALEMERRLRARGLREGELFTATDGVALDLALSPDGKRLVAQVVAPRHAGLWLWDLDAPLADARERERARLKDPELPEEAAAARPERKVAQRLGTLQLTPPERPRWEEDGIHYRHRRFTEEGTLAFEEGRWNPGLAPGLESGGHSPFESFWPQWSPEGAWTIAVDGRALRLPFTPFGKLTWDRARGWLYGARDVQGVLNLVRLRFEPGPQAPLGAGAQAPIGAGAQAPLGAGAQAPFGPEEILTRTAAGAAYPAPTPDGKAVYFSLLGARGVEIRRLDLALPPLDSAPWTEEEAPFAPGAVRARADEPSRLPAPGPALEAHPYRTGESHLLGLKVGATLSPSGTTYLLGAAGNDILGRLDWNALGSIGLSSKSARGATVGGVWRGWAWQPQLQIFSQLERPSAQAEPSLPGFDLERRGFALGLRREGWALDHPWTLALNLTRERVERLETGATQDRSTLAPSLGGALAWNRGDWTFQGSAEARGAWGRTAGASWNLWRAGLGGEARFRSFSLEGSAQRGQVGGSPSDLDRFTLGGQSQGLLPAALEVNQVFQPALAARTALGDRYERWRLGALGLLYVEGTALWDARAPRPAYQRVAGLEVALDTRGLPVVLGDMLRRQLGHLDFSLGLHRVLDGEMKDRTVFTFKLLARF